jgi:hypothetical protein
MAEKAIVEQSHPGAFDFMKDGLSFLLLMLGIFLVYYYEIEPRLKKILGLDKDEGGFEFGKYVQDLGKAGWNGIQQLGGKFSSAKWGGGAAAGK